MTRALILVFFIATSAIGAESIWLVSDDGEKIGPLYTRHEAKTVIGQNTYTVYSVKGDATSISNKLNSIVIQRVDIQAASAAGFAKYIFESSYDYDPHAEGVAVVFDAGITPNDLPLTTLKRDIILLKDLIEEFASQCGLSYRVEGNSVVLMKMDVQQGGPAYPPQGVGSADP